MEVQSSSARQLLATEHLQLEFVHTADRWRHVISVRQNFDTPWEPLLESVEGNATDFAPPSPALQDCFLQELGPDLSEFQLLGQAGKNVYSAAIRLSGDSERIQFDFCLRQPATAPVPPILATYQGHRQPGQTPSRLTPPLRERGTTLVSSGGRSVHLQPLKAPESGEGTTAPDWDFQSETGYFLLPGTVAWPLPGTLAPPQTGRRSLCWGYTLSWNRS